jgi:small subunit ribosomal protein S20
VPNHKSAIKRARQNKKRNVRNKQIRSTGRTEIKKARLAIDAGDKDKAAAALKEVTAYLHSSVSKGVVHKNNAARRISRLAKQVNKLG